jgi:hypothetical protein
VTDERTRPTPIPLEDLRLYATSPHALRAASERRAAEVLALVEAVEAAREYFAQSLPYSNDPDADLAQENLRAALRRFTFKGYA